MVDKPVESEDAVAGTGEPERENWVTPKLSYLKAGYAEVAPGPRPDATEAGIYS